MMRSSTYQRLQQTKRSRLFIFSSRRLLPTSSQHPIRQYHATETRDAGVLPVTASGPPPSAPTASVLQSSERIERRKRQADILQRGRQLKSSHDSKSSSPLKKKFWSDVHVKEADDGYNIMLDARPLRKPNKSILRVPPSKPDLAHAIALEWDLLESAQQGLKNHNIPITSITSRASDILEEDLEGESKTREAIVETVMRYFDTDTLLCWAPERSVEDETSLDQPSERTESLRQNQIREARTIISYLTSRIWPGVEIQPVLESNSILPTPQPEATRTIVQGWVSGLPPYELAALERGVLACKSLLIAVRLIVEWSEEFRDLHTSDKELFGVEEAASASSLEVSWQTGMWGEVEDTHDVDKEDMRRQLGSVVLLVSGHKA
ncbi:MAG: hypothetical protein Q9160_000466 [Pyrenula sp. 1 TL-2023]